MAQYTVELFGRVRIMEGETVRLEQFRTRRSGLLLAYLACYGGTFVSRQTLGTLLWEDATEKTQRDRLRYEISLLKRTLLQAGMGKDKGIEIQGKDFVRLSDNFNCDVCLFETSGREALGIESTHLRLDALERTVGLYKAAFLSNYYEHWALEKRDYLYQLHQTFLKQMVEDMEIEGRIEKLYWERLLEE
jgi:DNA-binding SARP family transcriptional activator